MKNNQLDYRKKKIIFIKISLIVVIISGVTFAASKTIPTLYHNEMLIHEETLQRSYYAGTITWEEYYNATFDLEAQYLRVINFYLIIEAIGRTGMFISLMCMCISLLSISIDDNFDTRFRLISLILAGIGVWFVVTMLLNQTLISFNFSTYYSY